MWTTYDVLCLPPSFPFGGMGEWGCMPAPVPFGDLCLWPPPPRLAGSCMASPRARIVCCGGMATANLAGVGWWTQFDTPGWLRPHAHSSTVLYILSENPNCTFVTPTLLAGDKSLADVICHEIAHSWTGNLVTTKNWEHFWLNGETLCVPLCTLACCCVFACACGPLCACVCLPLCGKVWRQLLYVRCMPNLRSLCQGHSLCCVRAEGCTMWVQRKIIGRLHGMKVFDFDASIGCVARGPLPPSPDTHMEPKREVNKKLGSARQRNQGKVLIEEGARVGWTKAIALSMGFHVLTCLLSPSVPTSSGTRCSPIAWITTATSTPTPLWCLTCLGTLTLVRVAQCT